MNSRLPLGAVFTVENAFAMEADPVPSRVDRAHPCHKAHPAVFPEGMLLPRSNGRSAHADL